MQTSVTSVTSPDTSSIYQQSVSRPVAIGNPANSLNQPVSAQVQPATAVVPSYSPNQPAPVVEAQTNNKTGDQQTGAAIQAQQAQQPTQMADQRMAASVLTGAYDAHATQRGGTPNLGAYVAVSV